MRKRKWIVILLLCMAAMWACMSSGAAVDAKEGEEPEGVRIVRFDLHKSFNREVGVPAGIPGFFTYYYEGKEYHYGFRFDRNGEGVESKVFGTAYVWAPYSIIHYDAVGGKILKDKKADKKAENSTAFLGNVPLKNTRGDGKRLGNGGNKEQQSVRYATDYTIYGNSLMLSEGKMPEAERKGYLFLGWYVQTQKGEVQTEELEQMAEEGWFGMIPDQLNTRFTEQTKVLENLEDESRPAKEITLYAKWEKVYE